ncbi:MAG TPA: alpha/beta hydrolase [Allocoleopsis sp.]
MMSLQFLRTRLVRRGASALVGLGSAVLLGVGIGLGSALPTHAAEDIVITYGPLGRSIAISDLEYLAETGETPAGLRWYLRVANVKPEAVQAVLTAKLPLDLVFIDKVLYSLPGEFALYELGQVIHTKNRVANIQALRSAVTLSVSDNGTITVLDFLKNYPTPQLYIDGVEAAKVARDVSRVVGDVQDSVRRVLARWTVVRQLLESTICDCENPTATTAPRTSAPRTLAPRSAPRTTEPSTTEPSTTEPSTTVPTTTEPSTTEPSTTEPSTTVPTMEVPATSPSGSEDSSSPPAKK